MSYYINHGFNLDVKEQGQKTSSNYLIVTAGITLPPPHLYSRSARAIHAIHDISGEALNNKPWVETAFFDRQETHGVIAMCSAGPSELGKSRQVLRQGGRWHLEYLVPHQWDRKAQGCTWRSPGPRDRLLRVPAHISTGILIFKSCGCFKASFGEPSPFP